MPEIDCRAAQPEDIGAIREIVRDAFDVAEDHPAVIDDLESETWYAVDNWIVAESNGVVVSAMGLRPGQMWIVGVPVPCSTVGTVCTLAAYRGQGIGSRMMRFAHHTLQERQDILSRLHTGWERFGFYGRLGYVKVVNNTPIGRLKVAAVPARTRQRVEEELGEGVVREAAVDDAARLLEIYNATFSHTTGALSRNAHFFERRIARKPKVWLWYAPKVLVLERPDDGVVAYAVCGAEDDRRDVVEIAALPEHAALSQALLMSVVDEARQHKQHRLDVYVDTHHPLGWLVRSFRIEVAHDSFITFLKVHDTKRFLEMMMPVVEKRAQQHGVALTLSLAGMDDFTVGTGEKVHIVSDVPHLAALIYNGAWLSGLLGQGALGFMPDTLSAHHLVQQVFPDTHAQRCPLDGY
jgi:predicted acetyltransferase